MLGLRAAAPSHFRLGRRDGGVTLLNAVALQLEVFQVRIAHDGFLDEFEGARFVTLLEIQLSLRVE